MYPPNFPQQPPVNVNPPKKSKAPLILALAMLVTAIICFGGVFLVTSAKDDPSPTTPTTHVPTKSSAAVLKKVQTISDGTWRVGTDVKPGKYMTAGMAPEGVMCYWHTAKDDSNDNILDQGVATKPVEQGLVTLKTGQYFKTTGCKPWTPIK